MFCKKCGAEIDADSLFCSKCGAQQHIFAQEEEGEITRADEPEQTKAETVPAQIAAAETGLTEIENEKPASAPVKKTEKGPSSLPIFILGIAAAALSVELGIGAIVCGIICRKKVRQYTEAGGELTGKAKVGNILGQVGLIVGIVTSVLSLVSVLGYVVLLIFKGFDLMGTMGQQMNNGISVFDKFIDLINRIMDYSAQLQSITFT